MKRFHNNDTDEFDDLTVAFLQSWRYFETVASEDTNLQLSLSEQSSNLSQKQ